MRMALERIHLYYFVRVLRVVVPILVVGFAGVFTWNYLGRRGPDRQDGAETRLEENMSALTEGVVYTQTEDGRQAFSVSAVRSLGFEGGVNRLEGDVEITIPGDGESPVRRIFGQQCGVDQDEGTADCEGEIQIDLDERTTLRTELLSYDDKSETASTTAPVQIVRPGEFEVRADRMRVLFGERLMHLEGNVRVMRADGSRLEASSLRYDERSGLVEVAGRVHLVSSTADASGLRGHVLLLPGSTAVSGVRIRGDVRVRSMDASSPGVLEADELDVDVNSGRAERAEARGNVHLDRGTEGDAQTLSGDVVTATFDSMGALLAIESTGDARMRLDSGETIRSDVIRQSSNRAIETGDRARLELEGVRVDGRFFRIEQRNDVQFATNDPASIALPAGVFRGDRTRASIDPDSGTILTLEQTGSVDFELDGRAGSAQAVRVDETWIEFNGRVSVEDPAYTLEAETIRLHRTDDSIEADDSVFLVQRGGDEPVFVTSDSLRGDADEMMRFEGSVVLRRGRVQVLANTIDVDPDGRSFVAEGDVASAMDDMTVRASTLHFDDAGGFVHYSGQVQARTTEIEVDSGTLDVSLLEQEIDRIDAAGAVRVRSKEGMRGTGEAALYLRSEGTVALSGPGAEATDPAFGTCAGERIIVDIRTHDATVLRGNDGLAMCVPVSGGEDSAVR